MGHLTPDSYEVVEAEFNLGLMGDGGWGSVVAGLLRELGRRRAHQGVPIDDVMRAFRVGYTVLWEGLSEIAADSYDEHYGSANFATQQVMEYEEDLLSKRTAAEVMIDSADADQGFGHGFRISLPDRPTVSGASPAPPRRST